MEFGKIVQKFLGAEKEWNVKGIAILLTKNYENKLYQIDKKKFLLTNFIFDPAKLLENIKNVLHFCSAPLWTPSLSPYLPLWI